MAFASGSDLDIPLSLISRHCSVTLEQGNFIDMRLITSLFAFSFAVAALPQSSASAGNLMDTIAGQPGLSKFSGALRTSGLDATLATGKYTVFAPTDATIEALPEGQWTSLLDAKNRSSLTAFLKGHIVRGDYSSKKLVAAKQARFTVPSLGAKAISIDKRTVLKAGDAALYRLDLVADNGVVHVVDKLMQPGKAGAAKAEKAPPAEKKKKFQRIAKRR